MKNLTRVPRALILSIIIILSGLQAPAQTPNSLSGQKDQSSGNVNGGNNGGDPDAARRDAAAMLNGGGPPVSRSSNTSAPQSTIGCPFYQNTPTVGALIATTRQHLQSLVARANQDRQQCGAVAQNLQNTNAAFDNLTSTISRQVITTNPGRISCINYEASLRQDYNLAIAENNGTITTLSSRNTFTQQCQGESDVVACIQNLYTQALSSYAAECRNTSQQNANADTRQNLETMTAGIEALITNADTCGSIGRESILQSALQQATSTASLAAGIGLPSLGISIVGRLLSSLADRIFNANNPERFLRAIDDDNQRPGVQCLFYDLQRTALRCDSLTEAPPPAMAAPTACETNISHLTELSDFARRLNGEMSASAPTSPDAATVARTYDVSRTFDRISEQIAPNRVLLQSVAERLKSDSTATNRSQGQKLTALLEGFNTLNAPGSTPTDAQLADFVSSFANVGPNAVNVPDILQRYLEAQSASDQTFAQALTNSSVRRVLTNTSAESANIANDISRTEQSMARLNNALTAMVRVSKNKFADRIETLKNNWLRSGANTSSPEQKMPLLNELFTMCMTTQGMSYFNGTQNVHLFSEARPNPKYQGACQMFECRDAQNRATLFTPFDPADTRYGNGTVADKFARYQCAQNRSLNEKLNQLRNNITQSGQICGR